MSDFESLLEQMMPGGAGQDDPVFPRGLDLEPRGILGRGGVGVVFRAFDPVLGREVAVKISRTSAGAQAREALLYEAQLTAKIRHPAVLPVHRVAAVDGQLVVIFALAPARTVQDALRDARGGTEWSLDGRLSVLAACASALCRAHSLDVVHGDIHPGNVGLGNDGEAYMLDWSGIDPGGAGSVSGHVGFAAPERLRGDLADRASDVYALGALAFELTTLKLFRPRRTSEPLAEYVHRWRDASPPDMGELAPVMAVLVGSSLSPEAENRPTAAEFLETVESLRTGRSTRERRSHEATELIGQSRAQLHRYSQLSKRIVQEQTVVTVQRGKVPGHAPVAQKSGLWAAEDRVHQLRIQRSASWVGATEGATRVLTLAPLGHPSRDEASRVLARLWWERMLEAEQDRNEVDAIVAERWVRNHDDGTYVRAIENAAHLDLDVDAPQAIVRLLRVETQHRIDVPVLKDTTTAPLEQHPLAPGSWLLEIDAPGRATTRFPVFLDRLEQHQVSIQLFEPEQVGEGWIHIPAGRFKMGGDPRARQPLNPCEPWLPDFFVQRTCVTAEDWLVFLNDLPVEDAQVRVPGEAGLFGASTQRYWSHDGQAWTLPPGWNPQWPIFSIDLSDIEAYAAWRSTREGRTVRLPTEEEWEKAARGADGRSYPWGDFFDPTFAHMRQSKPGPPHPHAVAGYPVDTSIYGCRDMGGGMRELTSTHFDEGQLVIRGGTWGDDGDDLRCANRAGLQPTFRYGFISFRLVADGPLG